MHVGERFNALSHLAGALLAAVGTVVLVVLAARVADPWRLAAFVVYGTTLFAQYVSSFLYHSAEGPAKQVLRNIDHCAIYLLIAGTYAPFTLVTLREGWGWPLFLAIWGLALVGLIQEIWFTKRSRTLSIALYVLMGWLAVVAVGPLLTALSYRGFAWIAVGGLLYTVGIFFYIGGKKGLRHGHGIWHLFVLGGSAGHYFAVLFYVA